MLSLPSCVKTLGYLFVLVTGGREYCDEYTLHDMLDRIETLADNRELHMIILQGGARGADALARQWAWHNNHRCITERANWDEDGKAAGPRRNQRMLDRHPVDLCVATPGGRGTADMIARCLAAKVPIIYAAEGDDET